MIGCVCCFLVVGDDPNNVGKITLPMCHLPVASEQMT